MNKKLISMISCGAITATVIIGFNELTQEIEKLNVSIEQIEKEKQCLNRASACIKINYLCNGLIAN